MRKVILYSLPFIIASLTILLTVNENLWIEFFRVLNVPPQLPPFSDLDAISKAVDSRQAGFNPYENNPYDLKNKTYVYPSIWLHFFELFNLNETVNFKVFNFVTIYIYTFIYLKLIYEVNKNFFSLIIIVLFFSSANLLAIERLNIEIIIFIFIYFLAVSNSYISKIPLFVLAIYGKLYPLFSVFIFLKNKKILLLMIFASLLILLHMKEEIIFLTKYGNEVALNIAYGVPTLTKGIWYYSMKFGYFINDDNYKIFKYTMVFLASIYALLIILINFRFGEKNIENNFSLEEKLFICGAGIFIGRFINFSNVDYSLIFLIFAIPYIYNQKFSKLKYFFITCIIISFYSAFFEFGDRYTLNYFSMAVVIHSIKIFVFSYTCFLFGKVLNKHLKIKLFN